MNLFEELRHRNVFKVAIAYIVVGWVLVQIADVMTDSFSAPDWVMKVFIGFLLLGLPVAVVFAWAFELTPEGLKRARDLPPDMPKDPRSGRFLSRVTIVTLVVAVAWLGWDKLQGPRDGSPVASTDKSIAILPFSDFSPEGDHAWFADGLTDEILNALARTGDLRVASRTSSFVYRDADEEAPEIGRALDVAHILEGSVRRAGDRIRVTAQLIRAADDVHLWSETFDASSRDSIEIQEAIAFRIASILDTALDADELAEMVAAGTESIDAWESYLRMREFEFAESADHDSRRAWEFVALYQSVIDADPQFAEAHATAAYVFQRWLDPSSIPRPPEGLDRQELRELFTDSSRSAIRYARTDSARLSAEINRAVFEVRPLDFVQLAAEQLELDRDNRDYWRVYLAALLSVSDYDRARGAVEAYFSHDFGHMKHLSRAFQLILRIDPERGAEEARRALALPSPPAETYYQAHRAFLNAGLIAEAAELARRYEEVATTPDLLLMVRIRQACAEGRVNDADALFEEFGATLIDDAVSNLRWLALQTLGRHAEALATIRNFDHPDTLFSLFVLMPYTHFDPRPFPNLNARLVERGAARNEAPPMNFFCKR